MARDTIAVHWEAAAPRSNHAQCAQQVEDIRRFHRNSGYSDIAYSWLVCNHGQIFQGRGWGNSAATCGSAWNSRADSVCWMGGPGYSPSGEALNSIRTVILQAQARGMGNVIGHRDACSTQCPGDELWRWVHAGFPGGSGGEPPPPPAPKRTGHLGMFCRDRATGIIWHVAPGGVIPETSMDVVNRKKYVGVADAGDMSGLEIIRWAQEFGAWDYDANDFKYFQYMSPG